MMDCSNFKVFASERKRMCGTFDFCGNCLPEKKKRVQRGVAVIREREKECIVELEREVDLDNAIVLNGGSILGGDSSSDYSDSWDAQLELIDSKHIRVTRAYQAAISCSVAWQVVELG